MMKTNAKILVVDDDPNLRKTLADILKFKGYEVVIAATGTEAIAVAERETVNLALIDLMLPDMHGLEVMERIKAITPLTEAIILTGHASMETAIEATKKGAFSYLLKPYQMDDLLLDIRHGVERQQAQEEILRLASFPRLLPSPVIELDTAGNITYTNPAAEKLFPELNGAGLSHPLLSGLAEQITGLCQNKQQCEMVHEVEIGEAVYELHVSFVQEVNLTRIYGLDITQRKHDEKAIHILATTDSLTGIANRREFTAILVNEVARAKRYNSPLSLVMYDIDYFKRVNDSFGHDVGDYVLQELTHLVQKNIRSVDVVARWGGEEFMLLMPQVDLQAATVAAEKLRLAIDHCHFDRVNHLTVSFGVVTFEPGDELNLLLKRADDALYQAKQNGRNRVETLMREIAVSQTS